MTGGCFAYLSIQQVARGARRPVISERERLEHERRKAAAVVLFRLWCARQGFAWLPPSERRAGA